MQLFFKSSTNSQLIKWIMQTLRDFPNEFQIHNTKIQIRHVEFNKQQNN